MKPIVLKENNDGSIVITSDEIQKIIEDAYQAGFDDGRRSVPVTVTPTIIEPWWRQPWSTTDHVTITCRSEVPECHLRGSLAC